MFDRRLWNRNFVLINLCVALASFTNFSYIYILPVHVLRQRLQPGHFIPGTAHMRLGRIPAGQAGGCAGDLRNLQRAAGDLPA